MTGARPLQYILALFAGILIIIMPRLLNYIVAIYLIVIGIMGLIAPARRAAIIEKRKTFQKKLEVQLEEWNAQIALFISKAEKAGTERKFEYDRTIEVLQQKQGEMRIKLQELKSSGDEMWEELKTGAEQAWEDLKIAFDKAASKFK